MHTISIITVNFNNRDGLRDTVESVISQTYGQVEYIIIDGGSTDGSAELIKNYEDAGEMSRFVRYYSCSEHDGGIYFGMNKGIAYAKGDYCLFLNSGDTFCNKKVLKKVFGKSSYTEDLIVGRQLHYNKLHLPTSRTLKAPEIDKFFFFCDTLPHQCTFIKRDLFNSVGGYHTDYRVVSDWIFWYEVVVDFKASIRIIPDYVAHQQPGGISSNTMKCIEETNLYLSNRYSSLLVEDIAAIREKCFYSRQIKIIQRSWIGRNILKIMLRINK